MFQVAGPRSGGGAPGGQASERARRASSAIRQTRNIVPSMIIPGAVLAPVPTRAGIEAHVGADERSAGDVVGFEPLEIHAEVVVRQIQETRNR